MQGKPRRLSRKFFQRCGCIGGQNKAAKMTAEQRKALGQQRAAARLTKKKKLEEEAASAISLAVV